MGLEKELGNQMRGLLPESVNEGKGAPRMSCRCLSIIVAVNVNFDGMEDLVNSVSE